MAQNGEGLPGGENVEGVEQVGVGNRQSHIAELEKVPRTPSTRWRTESVENGRGWNKRVQPGTGRRTTGRCSTVQANRVCQKKCGMQAAPALQGGHA